MRTTRPKIAEGRRRFLGAAALVALPLAARAQGVRPPPPDGKYRVVLRMIWSVDYEREIDAISGGPSYAVGMSRALADLGFVEGVNLELVRQHLPDATRETRVKWLHELTTTRVDAVVVVASGEARRVREVTSTVPVVAWDVPDPVALGLAKSFKRPGGNVTGLTYGFREVVTKQVHFLQRLVPRLAGIAVFAGGPKAYNNLLAETAITAAGLKLRRFDSIPDLVAAAASLREHGIHGVLTVGVGSHAPEIAREAIRGGIATIGVFETDAKGGMLASYGEHHLELTRRIAQQVATLLRGASPAETPFMEPTRFKFTLNRSTARALRLELPPDLLVMADEVYD